MILVLFSKEFPSPLSQAGKETRHFMVEIFQEFHLLIPILSANISASK